MAAINSVLEISKINGYRAPRDKVICILNCCKVIFGLLKNTKKADTSADSFIPLLIYVVLHANPDHLVSNIQYILRFRNQDKLCGEAGYYISSLVCRVQFTQRSVIWEDKLTSLSPERSLSSSRWTAPV